MNWFNVWFFFQIVKGLTYREPSWAVDWRKKWSWNETRIGADEALLPASMVCPAINLSLNPSLSSKFTMRQTKKLVWMQYFSGQQIYGHESLTDSYISHIFSKSLILCGIHLIKKRFFTLNIKIHSNQPYILFFHVPRFQQIRSSTR